MQAIVYYISLPFIYLISILPFWLLYGVSDFIYLIVYHIFGYRKKVVLNNLRNSFPDKSEKEINKICKKFYSFFCDWIVEMIKSITISKDEMIKRCHFNDTSLLDKFSSEKRKVIFVMGHFGNYELAAAEMAFNTNYNLHVIYKPLSNKYFNDLINKKRKRFGTQIMPMSATFKTMLGNKNSDELSATTFIADQTPSPENAYWTSFLNQDTPIFWGTEVLASKLNYPVIYVSLNRVKRGHYKMDLELLCENPKDTQKGEISEIHTKRLEQDIKRQPEIWLWSHKRWKHQRTF
ncbi:lysophospholipid acyltransferase family protein [Vicingaceae bacterium]|nr:lysophospholipid acyltransferase family protein [Vicingaceae bacterium]